MDSPNERLRRRTLLCCLGGVLLVALVVLSIGPPATAAIEGGENVTVYRTPNATFESAESIETAITNGTLEPAGVVAFGDTLVVAIESDRLAGAMNETNSSATAQFFRALDGEAEFRIVQTNPTPEKNRKIASIGRENVTVHRSARRVYAVVETANLTFRYRRVERPAEIFRGERFAVQFGYDLPDDWSRGTVPSSPILEFQPRSQLQTEQTTETPTQTGSETTAESPASATEERGASTATTTGGSSTPGTMTAESSVTTRERAHTTADRAGQTEAPGVAGFTVPAAFVALLVLAVRRVRRS